MAVGITNSAATIFAPTQSNGAARRPSLADTQRWGVEVERLLDATASNGPVFTSVAAAAANLNWAADTMGWVINATTPAENGVYRKVGASGSGSWVRVGDLPYNDVNVQAAIDAAAAALAAQAAAESAAGSLLSLFTTRTAMAAATISSGVVFARTAGYATNGDGGHALYVKVASEPSHAGKVQSADGAWWEIVPEATGVDPIAIGAVANGSTNDSTALTNAAGVCRHFAVPMSLRANRVYAFTSAQDWGALPGIRGRGTLKAVGITGDAIRVRGSVGTAKTLSSEEPFKSTSLNIAAHGFSAEQWLWIRSGDNAMAASSLGNRRYGDDAVVVPYAEFVQVSTVTDADNVALNGATYYAHPATTTSVYPVTFLQNLDMREFTFDGGGTSSIEIQWCLNPTIARTVRVINPGDAGFTIEHTMGGEISPTVLRAANSDDSIDPSAYQGVKVRDGCQSVVLSPFIINGEQGVDVTYTPSSSLRATSRDIRVIRGQFFGVNQQAVTCHEGVEGLIIEENFVIDGGDGVSVRGPLCVIRNNRIYGRTLSSGTGNEGIRIGNEYANSTVVEGNEVENFETGIYALGSDANRRRDEIIRGNRVRNCRTGISVLGKASATLLDYGLLIEHNLIVDCLITGIELGNNLNGSIVRDNTVRQELRAALTTYCIRVGAGSNLQVSDNRGVDVGASIPVISLSASALGVFRDNMPVGTTAPPVANVGSTIDLQVSVNDDAVWSMPIATNAARVEVMSNRTAPNGIAWVRNGASIHVVGVATFATGTGVLTGTTGTDGNLTVSMASNVLYVENRSGINLTGSTALRIVITPVD